MKALATLLTLLFALNGCGILGIKTRWLERLVEQKGASILCVRGGVLGRGGDVVRVRVKDTMTPEAIDRLVELGKELCG